VSALTAIAFTSLTKADPYAPERAPMEHAYIRSNGDIDPPNLSIQRSDNVYTLNDNLAGYTLEIQKDNVLFDGNGFSITAPSWGEFQQGFASIQISERNNIIIRNVTFDNCFTAIKVTNSTNILIIQNSMKNGGDGVGVYSCANCTIVGNSIIGNAVKGLSIQHLTFLTIAYNTIARNNYYGIDIYDVSNSNVSRNDITDNNNIDNIGVGLHFIGSNSNNRIFENNFINNDIGLSTSFDSSLSNTICNNYWNNYKVEIHIYNRGASSDVDLSPLLSPISTSFDPVIISSAFNNGAFTKGIRASNAAFGAFPNRL
jgi:hypothetical protein